MEIGAIPGQEIGATIRVLQMGHGEYIRPQTLLLQQQMNPTLKLASPLLQDVHQKIDQ